MIIKCLICTVLLAHTAKAAAALEVDPELFETLIPNLQQQQLAFQFYEQCIDEFQAGTLSPELTAAARRWEQSAAFQAYRAQQLRRTGDIRRPVFNGMVGDDSRNSSEGEEKRDRLDSDPGSEQSDASGDPAVVPPVAPGGGRAEPLPPLCGEGGCTWRRVGGSPCPNRGCPSHARPQQAALEDENLENPAGASSSWKEWLGLAPWVALTGAALAIPEMFNSNANSGSSVNPRETSSSYSSFWPICTAIAGGGWYNWDAITEWWNGDSESDPTEAQPEQADAQPGTRSFPPGPGHRHADSVPEPPGPHKHPEQLRGPGSPQLGPGKASR